MIIVDIFSRIHCRLKPIQWIYRLLVYGVFLTTPPLEAHWKDQCQRVLQGIAKRADPNWSPNVHGDPDSTLAGGSIPIGAAPKALVDAVPKDLVHELIEMSLASVSVGERAASSDGRFEGASFHDSKDGDSRGRWRRWISSKMLEERYLNLERELGPELTREIKFLVRSRLKQRVDRDNTDSKVRESFLKPEESGDPSPPRAFIRQFNPHYSALALAEDLKVTHAVFSATGRTLFLSARPGHLGEWDWQTVTQKKQFHEESKLIFRVFGKYLPSKATTSMALSQDGRYLVTVVDYKEVLIWDTNKQRVIKSIRPDLGKKEWLRTAELAPDNSAVVVAADSFARIYNVETGRPRLELGTLSDAMVHALGDLLASRRRSSRDHGHGSSILSAKYSKDGRMIVTTSRDRLAKVWDARSGLWLMDLGGDHQHHNSVTTSAVSPQGDRIVTVGDDFSVKVWDGKTGQWQYDLVVRFRGEGKAQDLAFSKEGDKMAVGFSTGHIELWNIDRPRLLADIAPEPNGKFQSISKITFSPDDQKIGVIFSDERLRLLELYDVLDAKDILNEERKK